MSPELPEYPEYPDFPVLPEHPASPSKHQPCRCENLTVFFRMVYLLHHLFRRGSIRPEDQTDAFGTL